MLSFSNRTVLLICLLTLLSLMAACTIVDKKQASQALSSDCESISSDDSKLKCYIGEIRSSINLELIAAIRDWTSPGRQESLPRRGVKIAVELYENGTVKKVILTRRSDSFSFNEMIIQTIEEAGPFALPKDKELRKRLLKFGFNIEF